jgi:hypothetical protein
LRLSVSCSEPWWGLKKFVVKQRRVPRLDARMQTR